MPRINGTWSPLPLSAVYVASSVHVRTSPAGATIVPVQPVPVPATVVPFRSRTATSAHASAPRPATATRYGTRLEAGTTALAAGHSRVTCGGAPEGEVNDARFHASA